MVRITPYTSQITPQLGGAARGSPEAEAAIGNALQRGGQQIAATGLGLMAEENQRLAKQKYADDTMWTSNTVSSMYREWTERSQKAQAEAPLGAEGYTDKFMKDFDAWAADQVAKAPNAEAGQMLQERLNSYAPQLLNQSLQFEAGSKVFKRKMDMSENIDKFANTILSDPSQYDFLRQEFMDQIESTKGFMPADEVEQLREIGESTLAQSAVYGDIQQNPYEALKDLKAGEWDNRISSSQKLTLMKSAESEINQREAEARANRAAKMIELKGQYDGAMDLLKMGLVPKDAPQLLNSLKGTPLEAPFTAALNLAPALSNFNLNAAGRPAGQQLVNDLAMQLQANPTPENLGVFQMFEKAHKDAATELSKDPLSFAVTTGGVKSPGAIDFSSFESMQTSLAARVETAAQLKGFTGQDSVPFTDEEISSLTSTLQNMDADGKIAMLSTMQKALGPDIMKTTADALAPKDPMLGYIAGVASEENGLFVARDVLKGQKVVAASPDVKPESIDIRSVAESVLGNTLAAFPEMQQRVIDASVALAASKANEAGTLTKDAVLEHLTEAMTTVAGGVTGKTGAIGGPVEWQNGSRILPPVRGMQYNEFDQRFSTIKDTDLLIFGNGQPMYGESGEKFLASQMEDVRLMQAGDGAYTFFIPGQGYIFNDKGEPYVFRGSDYVKSPPHQPVIENRFSPIKQQRYNMITGGYTEYYVDPDTGEEVPADDPRLQGSGGVNDLGGGAGEDTLNDQPTDMEIGQAAINHTVSRARAAYQKPSRVRTESDEKAIAEFESQFGDPPAEWKAGETLGDIMVDAHVAVDPEWKKRNIAVGREQKAWFQSLSKSDKQEIAKHYGKWSWLFEGPGMAVGSIFERMSQEDRNTAIRLLKLKQR